MELRIRAFLSQLNILCLGEVSFALEKTGVKNQDDLSSPRQKYAMPQRRSASPWRTQSYWFVGCSHLALAKVFFALAKVFFASENPSHLISLVFSFALVKLFLRLGEGVPLVQVLLSCSFCPLLCLLCFQYLQNSHI